MKKDLLRKSLNLDRLEYRESTPSKPVLLELDKEQRERYISTLKSFSDSSGIDKSDKIRIDKSGFSPEVAEVLGQDYLFNRIVIVSEQQAQCPVEQRGYSFFGEIVERIYSDFNAAVKQITPFEPIVAEVIGLTASLTPIVSDGSSFQYATGYEPGKRLDLNKFFSSLQSKKKKAELGYSESGSNADIQLIMRIDTPDHSLEQILAIQEEMRSFESDVDSFLLSESGIDKLVNVCRQITPLNERYGPGRVLEMSLPDNLKEMLINYNLDIRGSFRFCAGNHDVYVFLGKHPFIVYSGNKKTENNTKVSVLGIEQKDEILNKLLAYGHVKWDMERAKRLKQDMEIDAASKAGICREEIERRMRNQLMFYRMLSREDVREHLDKQWHKLNTILYEETELMSHPERMEKAFSEMDTELKWKLVELTSNDRMIKELFKRINPDYISEDMDSDKRVDMTDSNATNSNATKDTGLSRWPDYPYFTPIATLVAIFPEYNLMELSQKLTLPDSRYVGGETTGLGRIVDTKPVAPGGSDNYYYRVEIPESLPKDYVKKYMSVLESSLHKETKWEINTGSKETGRYFEIGLCRPGIAETEKAMIRTIAFGVYLMGYLMTQCKPFRISDGGVKWFT